MQTKDGGKHDILWNGLLHPGGVWPGGQRYGGCANEHRRARNRPWQRRWIGRKRRSRFPMPRPKNYICATGREARAVRHQHGGLLRRSSARTSFAALGHTVGLIPPEYAAQKNDDRDAEGIAEAATRPTMRFFTLKSEESRGSSELRSAGAGICASY
jgi:hypothetical protein